MNEENRFADAPDVEIPKDEIIIKPELAEKLEPQNLSHDEIISFVKTMRNVEKAGLGEPPKGFRRVRMPKLLMPISFIEHVEAMSRILEVRPVAFYQGLLMEAINIYAERTMKDLRKLEEEQAKDPDFLKQEKSAGELALEKIKEEIDLLNEITRAGEFNDEISPADNIRNWRLREANVTMEQMQQNPIGKSYHEKPEVKEDERKPTYELNFESDIPKET